MQKNFVVFMSPGSFVSETTTKPINEWDVDKAVEMARSIVERHGATPYAFYFITKGRKDDELDSKIIKDSPMHYLGGTIYTLKQLKDRHNPGDKILIRNMECNKWHKVIENNNSWRITQPFNKEDILLDVNLKSTETD